jgi:hypothetical protein
VELVSLIGFSLFLEIERRLEKKKIEILNKNKKQLD